MARESITAGSTAGGTRRAATHYGTRKLEVQASACHSVEQGVEVLEIALDYSELPTFGLDELLQRIEGNARIIEASLHVTEAFVGGTSYVGGLYQPDGTVIDADGLFTAVDLAVANIGAVGDVVDGTGALIGVSIGADAGQVVFAETGTFTAGKAMVYVKFQRLLDRSQLND